MHDSLPIQLYVDLRRMPADEEEACFDWLRESDALVLDPARCTPDRFASLPVERAILLNGDPARDEPWRELSGEWVCAQGIEAAARMRDRHPQLHWIPLLSVSRAQVSYRFSGPAVGEGFSFYMPDTAAIKGWRVGESSLEAALDRATALGFQSLWLHSPEAASRGRGLELDLLDKTRRGDWAVWLSGGIAGTGHLRNLTRVGGASAVVVEAAAARACTLASMTEALVAQPPRPEAVPITFAPRKPDQGAP